MNNPSTEQAPVYILLLFFHEVYAKITPKRGVYCKMKILVIEDDTAISELICMNLEAAGYETRAIFDGDEAAEALKTEESGDTALALVDVMLPGKDGREL